MTKLKEQDKSPVKDLAYETEEKGYSISLKWTNKNFESEVQKTMDTYKQGCNSASNPLKKQGLKNIKIEFTLPINLPSFKAGKALKDAVS